MGFTGWALWSVPQILGSLNNAMSMSLSVYCLDIHIICTKSSSHMKAWYRIYFVSFAFAVYMQYTFSSSLYREALFSLITCHWTIIPHLGLCLRNISNSSSKIPLSFVKSCYCVFLCSNQLREWNKLKLYHPMPQALRGMKSFLIYCDIGCDPAHNNCMLTSSTGNIFRVTDLLWGESTGHQLWCFLWCASEQTVKQTVEMEASWDAITFIVTSP